MSDPLTLGFILMLAQKPECVDDHKPIDGYLIAGIARHESGYVKDIVGRQNKNGTFDYGLMQINENNFSMLGLGKVSDNAWKDPCQNIRAAGQLLHMVSRYATGSPTRGLAPCGPGAPVGCGLVVEMIQSVWKVKGEDTELPATPTNSVAGTVPPKPACAAPSWDVWGQADCRDHPPVLRAEPVVPEIREEVADATIN